MCASKTPNTGHWKSCGGSYVGRRSPYSCSFDPLQDNTKLGNILMRGLGWEIKELVQILNRKLYIYNEVFSLLKFIIIVCIYMKFSVIFFTFVFLLSFTFQVH